MKGDGREPARLRALALAVVVAGLGIAGGLPGDVGPRNLVGWAERGGLRFNAPSQVLSDASLAVPGDEFTIELWLSSELPAGQGNREILSFVDGPGVRPLVLGQWQRGYLVRTRAENPKGLPSRDHYHRLEFSSELRHVALVAREGRMRLHVDGQAAGSEVDAPVAPLRGRVLLGSSSTGWKPWRGEIRQVTVFGRSLGDEELAARASGGPAPTEGALALYRFDQPVGDRIGSAVPGGPTLILPLHIQSPSPPVLRFMWSVRRSWFRRDVALNLLGFVPLGFVVAWRTGRRGVLLAVASGLALSLAVELAQVWIPGRHSSAIDLLANTLGAACGAGLAYWLTPPRDDAGEADPTRA